MKKRYNSVFLVFCLFGMIGSAQAAPPLAVRFTTGDYFTIFLAAIVFVNLFLVLLYKILHREQRSTMGVSLAGSLGSIMGLLAIAIGSIIVVVDALVVLYSFGVAQFRSAYYFLTYFIPDPVVGIIATFVAGLLLFLVGAWVLSAIHGGTPIDRRGMPEVSGAITKGDEDFDSEMPLNPTLHFRVLTREDGKPAPDVKVVLKKRDGTKFHSKFSDFDGYVKFEGVEGYSQDHVAYVEGDEERLIFRISQL
jgi:hypothetical protein